MFFYILHAAQFGARKISADKLCSVHENHGWWFYLVFLSQKSIGEQKSWRVWAMLSDIRKCSLPSSARAAPATYLRNLRSSGRHDLSLYLTHSHSLLPPSQHPQRTGILLPRQSLIHASSPPPGFCLSHPMFLLHLQDASSTGSIPHASIHVQVPSILKKTPKPKHHLF